MAVQIDGVIFDLDGVITDTITLHYRAWKRLTDEEGIPFSLALNDDLRGLSRRASLTRILNGRPLDAATMDAWLARKNAYFQEELVNLTPADVLPGVHQWLKDARRLKLKVGLGSASCNAKKVLQRLDLLDAFDTIGDGYSVTNIKPEPDIFLWVAGRLDVKPKHTVVVEDGAAGIEAAHKGGFWTVGVGEAALIAKAHLRLKTLADLPLETLPAQLSQATR